MWCVFVFPSSAIKFAVAVAAVAVSPILHGFLMLDHFLHFLLMFYLMCGNNVCSCCCCTFWISSLKVCKKLNDHVDVDMNRSLQG